jgi:hypothetical protein
MAAPVSFSRWFCRVCAHVFAHTFPVPLHTPHFALPEPEQLLHCTGDPKTKVFWPAPLHTGHFTDPLPLQVLQVCAIEALLFGRVWWKSCPLFAGSGISGDCHFRYIKDEDYRLKAKHGGRFDRHCSRENRLHQAYQWVADGH